MSNTTERNVRVQILIPPRSAERLDRLVETTESSSVAEVVRNALRLYEAVIDGARRGEPFYQSIDGRMTPVLMIGPYAAPTDAAHPGYAPADSAWSTSGTASAAQLSGEDLDEVVLDHRDGWTWTFMSALIREAEGDGRATEAAIAQRTGRTRGWLRPWIDAGVRQGALVREEVDGQPGVAFTPAGLSEWRSNRPHGGA